MLYVPTPQITIISKQRLARELHKIGEVPKSPVPILAALVPVFEFIELSTAHMRKQFDIFSAQNKELCALAQEVATKAAEPIKAGVSKAFNKASLESRRRNKQLSK